MKYFLKKLPKKIIIFSTFAFFASLVFFQDNVYGQVPKNKIRFILGYKSLKLVNYRYEHDTHPDDYFLANAGVHGSAGATEVNGRLNFLTIGLGYKSPSPDNVSINFDLGLLRLLGEKRDGHQNYNDIRPASNAAFVYSQVNLINFFSDFGIRYHIERFFIGVEAELGIFSIESGWGPLQSR